MKFVVLNIGRGLVSRLQALFRLGTRPGQDAATHGRVILINVFASWFLLSTLLAAPGLGQPGAAFLDLSSLLSAACEIVILAVNMRGHFGLARFLLLAVNQVLLFAGTATSSLELNLHLLYFSHFVFPEILYGRGEKIAGRLFQASALLSFLAFQIMPPPWGLFPLVSPERFEYVSRLMVFASTIYLFVAIRFLGRIGEIYEAEDSHHRARLLMNAKMAALGEMAGGMAHEINNPLAIIRGKAEQIQKLASSGEVEGGAIVLGAQVIQKHSDRIAGIVRGLQSFARDGETDPFSEAYASHILHETTLLCRERFLHHGVELRISEGDQMTQLQCRPIQVEQVLINLLNNAFDALLVAKKKWVEIGFRERKQEIEFWVTDSGPRISAEIADKMLLPFFTTKSVGMGTGLGLSISSGIARAHGGELFLDRYFDQTRFVLVLPKTQPALSFGSLPPLPTGR